MHARARQHGRQIGHAGDKRHPVQPHGVLAQHQRARLAHLRLAQPAQTPVAFHLALEFVVAGVSHFKIAHRGEQIGAARGKGCCLFAQQRHQLPLIDEVNVTAQRRTRPGVAIHAEGFVRFRMRTHAHLAAVLHAVQTGNTGVGKQFAPVRVDENHQLGDELIQRRAALALRNFHPAFAIGRGALPVDGKAVIGLLGRGFRFAAPAFKHGRQFPEQAQFFAKRKVQRCAVRQPFFVEQGFQRAQAQVRRHRHALDAALHRLHAERARDFRIQRHRRTFAPLGQREAFHQRIGQHGDFVAGHIDRRQPLARQLPGGRGAVKTQRGRGDVDADAPAARRQGGDGKSVVNFRGARVINRKRLHLGTRQALHVKGAFGQRGRLCALREMFKQKTV